VDSYGHVINTEKSTLHYSKKSGYAAFLCFILAKRNIRHSALDAESFSKANFTGEIAGQARNDGKSFIT